MTLVVARTCAGGGVVVGADSFCGNAHWKQRVAVPKVFRTEADDGEPLLIAASGPFRGPQLLRNHLHVPGRKGRTTDQWVTEQVTEQVKLVYERYGFGRKKDEQSRGGGTTLLIAAGGAVFCMWDDYEAVRVAEGYTAIGAGDEIALGALCALSRGDPPDHAEACSHVLAALEAGAAHSPWVTGPFHMEALP